MRNYTKLFTFLSLLILSRAGFAETIQIEFTEDDAYSIQVAHINAGDTIEWLPKNEGHNVEFFGGPDMSSMPPTSEMDEPHIVVFKASGIYLYGCTPHADMGMLGLVIVDNDYHNLNVIKNIQFSRVGKSVLQRLLKIAQKSLTPK
jgi:plastocyanin